MTRKLLLVALLAAPAAALAQFADSTPSWAMRSGPSPRWGSVDIGAMIYTPGIDDEFDGTAAPFNLAFGGSRRWMFQLGISRALYTKFGSLEAGFRTGYWTRTGDAQACSDLCDTNNPVYDPVPVDTKLRIIPTSVSLTYRFDWHVGRYPIPLVPYVRATFERYNWWISDFEGTVERGATMGWSATGGVAFLLDILDPVLAREFDRDSGVNHTYLFAELTKTSIDDFGSSSSWDMSNDDLGLGLGLMFVF